MDLNYDRISAPNLAMMMGELADNEHSIIDVELASRMASAAGLRNLIAHRYAALDWARVHEVAAHDIADLLEFCKSIVAAAGEGEEPS